jgi:hypothetical protein
MISFICKYKVVGYLSYQILVSKQKLFHLYIIISSPLHIKVKLLCLKTIKLYTLITFIDSIYLSLLFINI